MRYNYCCGIRALLLLLRLLPAFLVFLDPHASHGALLTHLKCSCLNHASRCRTTASRGPGTGTRGLSTMHMVLPVQHAWYYQYNTNGISTDGSSTDGSRTKRMVPTQREAE